MRRMKSFLLFLVFCLMVAGIYLYNEPDAWQRLRGTIDEPLGLKSKSVTMYKWKNNEGVVQYTQSPPPQGVPYEEVELRSDVNILPLPEQLKE